MTILGILLLLLAGFSQGTFGLGMKHQKPLSWAKFWGIYSTFGMLIIPIIWGMLSTNQFWFIISCAPNYVLYKSILLGFLWGIGGILFGKSVEYVGISITNGVVMGLAGGLGAIIPLLSIDGITKDPSFLWVIVGVSLMLVGVFCSAYAGIIRERISSEIREKKSVSAPKSGLIGIIIVVVSGVLSSLLNVGFEAANPIVDIAKNIGVPSSASGLPARFVVVFGGFIMNGGYAIYLLIKNRNKKESEIQENYQDVQKETVTKASLWAGLTGFLWFLPLGLSGIVAARIGVLGNTITWPIMLSLSLIFGNIWGYTTGEWKGAKKAFTWMIVSSIILILACLLLTFKDIM